MHVARTGCFRRYAAFSTGTILGGIRDATCSWRPACSDREANAAASHLLIADLRGVESHGVARLPSYVNRLHAGLIDPDAEVSVERELRPRWHSAATTRSAVAWVPRRCAERSPRPGKRGICLTTVRRSNHFGIAGAYAVMATEAGLGGMAMTNAGRIVVPRNGSKGRCWAPTRLPSPCRPAPASRLWSTCRPAPSPVGRSRSRDVPGCRFRMGLGSRRRGAIHH